MTEDAFSKAKEIWKKINEYEYYRADLKRFLRVSDNTDERRKNTLIFVNEEERTGERFDIFPYRLRIPEEIRTEALSHFFASIKRDLDMVDVRIEKLKKEFEEL